MARVKLTLLVCQDGDREDKENQEGEGAWKRPIFTYGMAKRRIKEMSGENNVSVGRSVQGTENAYVTVYLEPICYY